MNANVEDILQQIDDLLDSAWAMPLSGGKGVVDVEQIRKWETQFHSELIKLSDNPQLERLYEFNWSVGSVYFVYSIKKVSPDNFRVSLREHQKILEALLNRDAEQLEFLVRDHLRFLNQAVSWYN